MIQLLNQKKGEKHNRNFMLKEILKFSSTSVNLLIFMSEWLYLLENFYEFGVFLFCQVSNGDLVVRCGDSDISKTLYPHPHKLYNRHFEH